MAVSPNVVAENRRIPFEVVGGLPQSTTEMRIINTLEGQCNSLLQVVSCLLHILSDSHTRSGTPDSVYPVTQMCLATALSSMGVVAGW